MGIKGLNAFLKKRCPEAFTQIHVSKFKGERIAIDSDQVLRRFMSRAHKETVDKTDVVVNEPDRDVIIKNWVKHVKYFVVDLLRAGITPVFIFDGDYIPEKSSTQQKRRDEKKKRINEAIELKKKIQELDILERTPAMITKLRKKMHQLGYLAPDEKEIMMGILSAVGIPVIRATGEGEKLCAMLCIEGYVSAAYSTDTDLTAMGCPLTITDDGGFLYNKNTHRSEKTFKCTLFKPILSSLGMEYEEFLDLCIMGGCDFNTNIYRLGLNRAYKLLQECKNIDRLPSQYDQKKECLNHESCREIFARAPPKEISQDPIVLDIDTDLMDARDRLSMYGADDWLSYVAPLYKSLPTPKSVRTVIYPKLERSRVKLVVI